MYDCDILIISLIILVLAALAYWAFMSSEFCIGCLDRLFDALLSSRIGKLATVWVCVSEKLRFVRVAAVLALLLILVSWFAFPYAGYHRFHYLSWCASLASWLALAGWWTWALARRYRHASRLLNLGVMCGVLYVLAVLEGTAGYYYWIFCKGYFLDFPEGSAG